MYQLKCPICKKRIFDVSKIPNEEIIIETKCSNCKQITKLAITTKNLKNAYQATASKE